MEIKPNKLLLATFRNYLILFVLSFYTLSVNTAFTKSNNIPNAKENPVVYYASLDWININSVNNTSSSNNEELSVQPFPNPDTDGDGVNDVSDLDDDNDGILDDDEKACTSVPNSSNSFNGSGTYTLTGDNGGLTIDITRLDNSFNMEINGTKLVTTEVQFDLDTYNSSQSLARFVSDDSAYGENGIGYVWDVADDANSVSLRVVINPSGEVSLYGSRTSNGPLELMYIQTGDPQFNNITLNESVNNTIVISQDAVFGATYIHGDYYFSELTCLDTDTDTDQDGIPNSLDLDSDGDGIPDNIEAQSTAGFTVPASDNAATYITNNGLNSSYITSNGITPIDTDADGTPDYLDIDSDNDQTNDNTEAIEGGLILNNQDLDNDGLDDAIDTDDNNFGPVNANIEDVLNEYDDTTGLNDASLVDVVWRVDCEFGKISEEQYASTSLGGYNIGATVPSPNVEGAPNGSGQNLYSGAGSPISLEYDTTFSGDAVVTITAKYNDSRQGYIFFEASTDGTSYETVSSNLSGFGTSYSSQSFTIPASFTDNFKYLRIGRQTGNTMYMNVDAVKVAYEICNDCPTGIDAPVLSATTITNSCPTQTMDLTSITVSNQPANTTLTWHTGVPATDANKLSAPATAVAGIYYASFYSSDQSCYTLDGEAITAVTADGDSDCDLVPNATDIDDDNDGVLDTEEDFSVESLSLLWLDASDETTITKDSDGLVSQWNDKSGNGHHATQSTPANQPTFDTDQINGGTSDWLNLPSDIYAGKTEGTLIIVGEQKGTHGGWGSYGSSSDNFTTNSNLHFYESFLATSRPHIGIASESLMNKQVIYSTINDGNTLKVRLDGEDISHNSVAGITFDDTPTYYELFKNYANYTLYEVIFLENDSSIQEVEGYLAHKWGLEASLPAGHPYKNAAISNDVDGDGIPNSLDLDSDGDGCSDALEAGATTNTTANYVFTGAVGANGLVDTLETTVDSGVINYVSTYSPNAVSDFLATCVDTDGDDINDLLDIDDDNDGILDATESPSCYYLANDVAFTNATTSLTNYSTNAAYSFTELYDGVLNNMAAYGADNTSITDETVYELELLFPVELSEIDIVVNYSVFRTGAEFKWQGYNGSTWVDVTGTLTETQATNTTKTYTLNSTGTKYYSYRLQGISGATWYNRIYEIVPRVDTATYQSSLHPKDNCSVDTDGDGTYNHLDLDSDGDGCSDALEAGATTDKTADYAFTGAVGANGLVETLETTADSGTINYTSTYNAYAINDAINACTDTDGDGVNDVSDLDDDNDGILDTVEQQVSPDSSFDSSVASTGVTMTGLGGGLFSGGYLFSTASDSNYVAEISKTMDGASAGSPFEISLKGIQSTAADNSSYFRIKVHIGNTEIYNELLADIIAVSEPANINLEGIITENNPTLKIIIDRSQDDVNTDLRIESFDYTVYDGDEDNDGIPNHLDLDSDGDGCSDSIEGVSPIPASPWSPAEITTSVWLDAADASTINGDANGVSQWDDKSGNDHHAVQTNNSYKPAHVQNDLNGKDGVDFFGKSLKKNTGTQTVGYVIAVLKAENATWNNYHTIFGHRANARFGGLMHSGNTGFHNNVYPGSVWVDGTSKTVSTSGFSTIDSPHIWSYTPNGNTVKTLTNGYNMGSYDNNNGGGSATQYEVVVLPTIPTDQEREKLEGYLAHKWDLAANLPVDHPYKNAAPESSNLVGGGSGATCNIFTKPSNNSTSVYNTGDDTNNNGLLDAFEGSEAGTTNYTSRYVAYALDNSINACTDSDGDDVGDIFDLDDDNDGVLDTTEGIGDTDEDGTPNHLDTDSDGDGCLDTIEAGTTNNGATTDANCNGLLDQYEDGVTNTINYTSTYNPYALNNTVNSCVDTDSDGVNDVFDIDDDNDGVLDTEEDFSVESLSLLWLDASDETTITKDSDGLVSQWNDKSGNGHHATQSTPANQPIFDTDQINGGTSDWLNLPSDIYAGKTEGTLIIVGEQTGGSAAWGNYGTSTNHTAHGNINFYDSFLATSRPHIGTTIGNESTLNRKLIYSVINDGSTLKVRSNGEDLPNGGDGIPFDDSPDKYELFRQSNYTLYEVIFLENDSSIQEVEGYLAHKWGLEASLPAGHPYKDFAISNDVDSDGIPNSLDLDSDGDGCSDALEAGATTDTTTDYVFTGVVGTNGLVDTLETSLDSGTINYTSTYNPYAVSDFLATCVDTDGDDINDLLDIDDDNDGILDATESPSCFYLANEVAFTNATTSLTNYNTNTAYSFTELYDGVLNNMAAFGVDNTSITNETVYELELLFPVELSEIDIVVNYSVFRTGAEFKWQGYNGSTWVDVTGTLTETQATNTTITYTLNSTGTKYYSYRLQGISGATWYNRIYEIVPRVDTATYQSSLHPKDNCSVDTDNDGTYNHLDTDSDNDTCLDTIEAGTSNDGTTTDANNNGLLDQYEDGTTGTINYESTYSAYAINDAINACADTDGDGVNDVFDLDDDNDGISDTVELLSIDAALWLDASDPLSITKDSNGLVSQWNDKSGNGHHATQSTTDNQPTTTTTTTVGTITFDGNDKLELPHGVIPDPTESSMVFMVGLSGSVTSPHNGFLSNGRATTSQSYSIRTSGSNMYWYAFNNDLTIPLTTPYTNLSIYGIDLNTASNTVKAYQNGELKATKNSFTGVNNTGTELGSIGVTPGSTGTNNEFLVGEIREIIVVKSQPSEADRQKIEGYLAWKWGLEGSLPSGHPYENAAPSTDVDGDGIPNSLDLDSDGDGIPDNIEAQTTAGYTVPGSTIDNTTGVNTTYGSGLTPIDTDADGTPDYLDIDSDNDQTNDNTEAIEGGLILNNQDLDNDGLDDAIDTDDNNFGPVNANIEDVLNEYDDTTGLNDASLVDVVWRVDCEFGKISEEQYASTSLGGYNIGATVPSPNVEGAPNGSGQNLYSGAGSPISLEYDTTFSGDAVITITAKYNDSRQGYIFFEASTDGTSYETVSSNLSGFGTSYSSQSFTIPASFTDNFKYLRIGRQTGNTMYMNVDAVKVAYEICNDCPTGIDAPVLSATTITNSCPTQTMDLTSITVSNQPANTTLTWHTGVPATDANKVSAPATASAGVYYASFYSSDQSCYTLEGEAVTAVTADGDSDCDGVPNATDIDDDNDGVLDTEEGICNLSGEQDLLLDDITLSGGGSPAKSTVTNYVAQQTAGSEEPSGQTFVNGFDNTGGQGVPFTITFNNPTTFNIANNELTIKFQYYNNIENTTDEIIDHYPSFNIETDAGDFLVDYTLTAAEKTSLQNGNWIPVEFTIAIAQSTVTINSMDVYLESINGGHSSSFSAAGSEVFALAIDGIQTGNSCIDTDGDGIPNSLDLDSDGDGCSDALEAGATTDKTADYAFTGAMGANGLVNTLETSIDSGTINYTSTYSAYAINNAINACTDTDDDGVNDVFDLDDDNDGILDATESPSCYYLANEFENGDRTEFVEVTTTLSMNATYNDLNETVDGVNGTGSADYAVRFTNSQSAIDQTVYQFEFQQAVKLSTIYIGYINANSHFINGASIKLQASNNNATWLDVNDGATYNQANSNSNVPSVGTIRNQAFEVTKNAGVYKYYRIQGVSGTIWSGGYSNEIYFETNNFNASLYPKDNCSVDTDDDGTYNHLDSDSDGDTCLDTIEAGTSNDGTTTDVNLNGLLDQYEDGSTGTINYTSTYNAYAINDAINACTDTDDDGVNDVFDLDDDNDGILDIAEENNFNVEEISETLPIGLLSNSTGLIRAVVGSPNIMAGTQYGVSTTPFNGTNYISFHTDNSGARLESFSIQLSEPLNAGESLNISFQAITLDNGERAWDNSSKIHIDGGNSFGDDSVNLYISPSTGNNSEGWKNYSFNYEAASSISHITIYNISDTNAESFVGIDTIIIVKETDTDGDGIPNSLDLDSDGDGCPDALEGAGAFTNSDLVVSSMDGGNTDNGGAYTGESTNPVQDNLGNNVDGNGIPTVASGGQGVGTSQTANPVFVEAEHINLAVSDVSYTSAAANAVFTITDALANFTYELKDEDGNSLNPQVLATQGSSTGDLDLTLLAANVPTGATSTTFKVVAGVSNACTVTLTDEPKLTLPDHDGDGVGDVVDLDDDNDGILDIDESNNTNTTNIQTDNTWKKSTVENATEGGSFNGVSFGDIPNSATFTEDVTIGNPANGTITGVDKIVAPLNKQTYYRKTFTLTNTTGFNEAIIAASRDNSCQIFINGNDVARTNSTPSVGTIFGLKINESGANQNGYNHTAFATFTSDNANDIFIDGENEIIFVLDDFGGSAGLSLDLDLTFYEFTDTDGDGIPNSLDLDSDGDGCPDALEGAGALTSSDLVVSSMDGGNTGGSYTGESTNPVQDNLGTTVDSDGIPTVASGGQGIGTSLTPNPVLDASEHINLAVSDVSYSSSAADAVFTITDAVANITYELVDANGASLNPQVLATQGSSTGDLDLTLLAANVPLGATSTTFEVVAGGSNACTVTLDDKPELTLVDTDGDGVGDITDLDDDNDGILDTIEDNLVSSLTAVAGASAITIDSNNFTVNNISGAWGAGSVHSNDLGIAPNEDFTLSLEVELFSQRYIMIGLNASGNNSTIHYSDIDYALYFNANSVKIYENGASKGTQSSVTADSDVFSIERVGTTITYSKNGTVFYTSLTASSATDYYIDSSMHDNGNNGYTISNIWVTTGSSFDTDLDGLPNSRDLDSDGDGCPDAVEGDGVFTKLLVDSSIGGGNTGGSYTGVNYGVIQNLGNNVDGNGVPTVASGGQGVGSALDSGSSCIIAWDGSENNDWTEPANWSTNATPGSNAIVTIPSGLDTYPTATGPVTVNSVIMNNGSSLIAEDTFDGFINFNKTLVENEWFNIASPVVGQDMDEFARTQGLRVGSSTGNYALRVWDNDYDDEDSGSWKDLHSATTGTGLDFISGEGRAVNVTTNRDVTFTGTMATEDVSIAIKEGLYNNYNLIGNPYPSYIPANIDANSTNNILTVNDLKLQQLTIWFWDHTSNGGEYVQRNHASSSMFIAPGQGFFINRMPGTEALPFNFTEAMQTHHSEDTFMRSNTTRPEIQLVLSAGNRTKDTEIYYIEGTTTGWDNGYDSSMFEIKDLDISTHLVTDSQGLNLGIQSLPSDNFEISVVPVGVYAASGELIKITASSLNLPAGINVYLEDKEDDTFTLLDDTSSFTTVLSDALNGIGRFYLHTRTESSLGTSNDLEINNISMYTTSEENLRIIGVQSGPASVVIYDILGKQIINTSFEGIGVNDIALPSSISEGVYIVRLKTETGIINKKINLK